MPYVLWNHYCLWGFDACGFRRFPLPTNLRPQERLRKL